MNLKMSMHAYIKNNKTKLDNIASVDLTSFSTIKCATVAIRLFLFHFPIKIKSSLTAKSVKMWQENVFN